MRWWGLAVENSDAWLSLSQYGLLGAILIMLLTGWLWAKPAIDDLQKRHAADRALWEGRVVPLLERLELALEVNTRELRTNSTELVAAIRELERLKRDGGRSA